VRAALVEIGQLLPAGADFGSVPIWTLEQLFTLGLLDSLNGECITVDRDFKNEVFSSYQPNPTRPCHQCGRKPVLAVKMLNPQSGRTVRMFKCQCGEQTWTEDKE
jgi:hypothetical protein